MPKATREQLIKLDKLLQKALFEKLLKHKSPDSRYMREGIAYLRHAGVVADNRGGHGKTPKPNHDKVISLLSVYTKPHGSQDDDY